MDAVSVEVIISVLKLSGADAAFEDGVLTIYPPNNGAPTCYVVPKNGQLARRLIIQIGVKCGIKSHIFWNPERLTDDERAAPPLSLVAAAPKRRK